MNIDSIMNPAKPTRKQIAAAFQMTAAVLEVIRTSGDRGIPSGQLYSAICDKVTLEGFQAMIQRIKATGLVTEQYHLLRYVGPVIAEVK